VTALTKRRDATGPGAVAQSGHVGSSRYTRSVAWRHRIALLLLLALTGLPIGGTLCATLCDSASTQSTHHGKDPKCEEPAASSSGSQISGQSEHDCSTHDVAIRQVATTAAERADLSAKATPTDIDSTSLGELVPLQNGNDFFDYASPPGTAPPTARPVVLRV
jgi:hypothetical protein